jgi:cyclopropane fatty-acyl-phospholipid synthase-like methyltransferase
MVDTQTGPDWDSRFAIADYLYGTAPNAFLAAQAARLRPGWRALALADGEGRNGVWLAEQGLDVLSVDSSAVAQEKARSLAAARGVTVRFERHHHLHCAPEGRFDVVAAIFIQFAGAAGRDRLFALMRDCLAPGGLVLLQGYRVEQLAYGTGGPPSADHLYTEAMLRAAFAGFDLLELRAHDSSIREGRGHAGMSALIDMVARKPGG